MDPLRALLLDELVGDAAWQTLAWCVGLSYLWAVQRYERDPTT